VVITDRVRAAGKEDARENAHIEAERVLMQEAVFSGKFDVAPTDVAAPGSRTAEALGQVAVSWRSGAAP
jgi:hypothetical protein